MKAKKILLNLLTTICFGFSTLVITSCGHEHTWNEIERTNVTCTEDGKITYHCPECEETKTVVVAEAKGHTEVIDEAVAATCTEAGLTEGKHCSVCNEVLIAQKVSGEATGHNYDEYVCIDCGFNYYTEGLKFTLSEDGTNYLVSVGIATDANIVIPAIYNEKPVTSIDSYAFSDCGALTSIVIPDSVTSIGNYAFRGCNSLEGIVVNSDNTVYDSRNDCNAIIETATNTLIVGCKNTTIPDSVTSIGENAFEGYSSLESIEIPDSVTSIGNGAFRGCSSLTSIEIPDSVTSIGGGILQDCSALTDVTISVSITEISMNTFSGCGSLTSIIIPDGVTNIDIQAFSGCSSLTSIELPDGVTSIEGYAFRGCSSLESIVIPDSVTYIGDDAFYGCSSLKTVYYKGTSRQWTKISGYYELMNVNVVYNYVTCTEGLEFKLIHQNTKYPYYYYYSVTGYTGTDTNVVIPSRYKNYSVTSIGSKAFEGCSSLKSITIGNSVTSIGYNAFVDCGSLINVYYTGTIEKWCNITFIDNYSNPLLACAYDTIGIYASKFYMLDENNEWYLVTNITIPDSVTSIGDYTFIGCSSLTSITIPDSVTSIGDDAFGGCSSLTTITIGNSVTSIGERAFSDCSSLKSITIGNGVKSIGIFAFAGGTVIENVYYTGTIEEWFNIYIKDVNVGSSPLTGAKNFYMLDENNEWYLVTNITIPDSVTSIEDYAFYGYDAFASITIPDSVTSIGQQAFYGCNSLTSIVIPDSVTSIGYKAFEGCTSLTDVYYTGTEEQWNAITIYSGNYYYLTNATIHYNYVTEE